MTARSASGEPSSPRRGHACGSPLLYRAFLVHVNSAILKKAQRGFNYKRASVGNLFLAGAQLFLGSVSLSSQCQLAKAHPNLPAATIGHLPICIHHRDPSPDFPCRSRHQHVVDGDDCGRACEFRSSNKARRKLITTQYSQEDGTIIAGQSEISHPSPPSLQPPSRPITPALRPPTPAAALFPPSPGPGYLSRSATPALFEARTLGDEEDDDDAGEEDDELVRNHNVLFNKDAIEPLESPICRIFYLNAYGNEIYPRANPQFIEALGSATR